MSGYVLLEDGARFEGELRGGGESVTGEVVFNTSMTGYQEAVTDPSYAGQIITFTYPLIGNYGVAAAAMESERPQARGVIMREAKNAEDAAEAEGGWLDWLGDCGVPTIDGVDTRSLVRHIRDRGAMRGGIFSAGRGAQPDRCGAGDERRGPGSAGDTPRAGRAWRPPRLGRRAPRGWHRHRNQALHNSAIPRAELPVDLASVLSLRQ
jgi:carbamoylphosphate synthase small subunit